MTARTVSLVLGSGGARGLAHIGVIQWLEHHGFEVRSIAGTSMGALVGGIYAAGRLPLYTRWVTALERKDVIRLLDFSFGRNSLFKGERVIGELKVLIGNPEIGDLPLSFTAVATDMDSGKEVWLNSGPLFDAIRASMAIPTIFSPYTLQGRRLMDGGLVNPVPIAPTLADSTDLTIAVNLNAEPQVLPPSAHAVSKRRESNRYRENIAKLINELQQRWGTEAEDESGFFDIISRSMDIMEDLIAQFKLTAYPPDIIVNIPRNVCSFYEFHRASEVIEAGRRYAHQTLQGLVEGGDKGGAPQGGQTVI
ncbi:MAG TPA: patatin-like phospholipase family protein [Gammaproteobacteria bacterium]|nr:patatin-like phospholipase family protein [Gammaproteobacteria bacterium]